MMKSNLPWQGLYLLGLFWVMTSNLQFLIGCSWKSQEFSQKVIIKVNNNVLTTKQYADQLARQLRDFDALSAKDQNNIKRAKDQVTKNFIIQSLTRQWSQEQHIKINDSELELEINKIRGHYPDDLAFRRVLAQEGLSFNEWRENLKYTLLERKVFEVLADRVTSPSDEEIKAYFEQNKHRYKSNDRIFLYQIVVETENATKEIQKKLKTEDFSAVAKNFSITPESTKGGELGWIERGTFEVFDNAFNAPLNTPTAVFKSDYGYHIFKITKKTPAGYLSFNEVKDKLKKELSLLKEQKYFSEWLDKQLRISKVYKDEKLIESLSVETRGD